MQSATEDPQALLDEERWRTGPWGGSEDGERCDKCRGRGRTKFECWSCLITGTNHSCPSCQGRVRYESKCPVCRGTGEVDGQPRRGLTAFPTAEALYHHAISTEANLVGTLVELEAELADDVDFDADQGSILVIPTAIANARPIEPDALDTIRSLSESAAQR
jgi:RecJ-like exonuclease